VVRASSAWLGFDSRSVSAAHVRSAWGRARVAAFAQAPLPAGALAPSPGGAVLADADAVREAAARALAALDGAGAGRVGLVLPDGLARPTLLDLPRGVAADAFARFRLASGLPFAASEAVMGTLALGRDRCVAAALSRVAVEAFEGLVRTVGGQPGPVFLSSLLGLEALFAAGALRDGVVVLLGDTTLAHLAAVAGRLVALRQRLRDDDAARLTADVARTAALAGLPADAPLALAGPGARRLHHELAVHGRPARLLELRAAGAPEAAEELAWLKGLAA
jgi:hypothetical protein